MNVAKVGIQYLAGITKSRRFITKTAKKQAGIPPDLNWGVLRCRSM